MRSSQLLPWFVKEFEVMLPGGVSCIGAGNSSPQRESYESKHSLPFSSDAAGFGQYWSDTNSFSGIFCTLHGYTNADTACDY